jgi:hypothetical protein
MEFNKSMAGLNKVLKIIIACLPLVNLLWWAYMIIRDVKNMTLVLIDVLVGALLYPAIYILNIVFLISYDEPVDFGKMFGISGDPLGASINKSKPEENSGKEAK